MNWFERLTGFREAGHRATQAQMFMEGEVLVSRVNGRRYRAGRLELLSLRAGQPLSLHGAGLASCGKAVLAGGNTPANAKLASVEIYSE